MKKVQSFSGWQRGGRHKYPGRLYAHSHVLNCPLLPLLQLAAFLRWQSPTNRCMPASIYHVPIPASRGSARLGHGLSAWLASDRERASASLSEHSWPRMPSTSSVSRSRALYSQLHPHNGRSRHEMYILCGKYVHSLTAQLAIHVRIYIVRGARDLMVHCLIADDCRAITSANQIGKLSVCLLVP